MERHTILAKEPTVIEHSARIIVEIERRMFFQRNNLVYCAGHTRQSLRIEPFVDDCGVTFPAFVEPIDCFASLRAVHMRKMTERLKCVGHVLRSLDLRETEIEKLTLFKRH